LTPALIADRIKTVPRRARFFTTIGLEHREEGW
jgi:hypothetical protein